MKKHSRKEHTRRSVHTKHYNIVALSECHPPNTASCHHTWLEEELELDPELRLRLLRSLPLPLPLPLPELEEEDERPRRLFLLRLRDRDRLLDRGHVQ